MRMLLFYILLALLGQQTTFLESENLKNSESEKGFEPRTMSHETFFESEKSVNISEICGNEKTNHKLVQKKSEKGCEQRAMSHEPFLESENLKTSESEKGCELRAMSHEQRFHNAQDSQHEAQSLKKTVDCCPLSVDYFESQIRLADSLYKNYLPQYNFEEVKAAVMFFDSCEQRAMSNEQKSPNAQSSQHEAQSLKKTVDCCPLTVDYFENQIRLADSLYKNYLPQYNFEEVKAAVMFFDSLWLTTDNSQRTTDLLESENLKTSESGKGSEQRAMSHEQKFRNAHSSKLEVQNTSQFFRGVGMVRATFYIGFTNLVYNMCRLVQIKRCHPDCIIN